MDHVEQVSVAILATLALHQQLYQVDADALKWSSS
jgi:hypothetical protein